ncbi:MAG: ATP-binding protein [Gemmatimonadetes bacterium]|nr:ATP-binding protein [Gemmatimonadota bacterium]
MERERSPVRRVGEPWVGPALDWVARIVSASAILVGSTVLVGWALKNNALKSVYPGWVSMKANTALAFVLAGLGLLIFRPAPSTRGSRLITARIHTARLFTWLSGAIGLLSLAEYAFDWNAGIDQLLFAESLGAVATSHPGRMSPDAAICFALLAVGVSIAQRSLPSAKTRAAALIAGSLISMIALSELFSYFAPALRTEGWGGLTKMAVHTAALFAVLGLALLRVAVQFGSPESTVAEDHEEHPLDRGRARLLFVFVLLVVGIIATGIAYYRSYVSRFQREVEQQLSAVAELKVGELQQWRKERIGDANILYKNPAISALVQRLFHGPDEAGARRELMMWLGKYGTHYRYDHIRLLDSAGVTRLSWPDKLPNAASTVVKHAMEAYGSGQVALQDFYRSDYDNAVRLALLIPILDEGVRHRSFGVIVLRIDPTYYLYPFIKRWPSPSRTAETLVVRREGNEVVFLNELRFQKNTALEFRAPLSQINMPAVQAALGREGVVAGIDYRGVAVLAAVRSVPDSPWALVARMDEAEALAPLSSIFIQVVVLMGALLLGAGAGVAILWQQQHVRYLQGEAASADALQVEKESLEQRVIARTAALEAANKEMEAFSYSVSHDLRAPLRSIDGFSRIVLEDYQAKLDDEGRDSLNRIRAAAQHMAKLIDDMLKLSRISRAELRRERVDLSAVARDVAEALTQTDPSRAVEFVITDGLVADGDPTLLRAVLDNLLGNAWKFTGRRAHARIEFGSVQQDDLTNYFVRDNGAGFNEAHAGKLFDAFQRLHSGTDFPGTGIGLATVRRIIHRHGGRVWAHGTVDDGATFSFTLSA